MKTAHRSLVLLSTSIALVAHVDAQEWTRFRGPNGSGVAQAPNFPVSFSEKDYNWKNITRRGELVVLNAGDKFQELERIPIGEGSFATPAVSGGRMYLRTFTHLISVGK